MNPVTLILIQIFYPSVFLNIQVLPSSPTCGIYGHITFRFSDIPKNFELNEIYIQRDYQANQILFRKTFGGTVSSFEGHMLYSNKNGAKLINLHPNLNGARFLFKFQDDNTGVEETVALEPLRISLVIQNPISKSELKKYEYALHSIPVATSNKNLKIQIYDKNLKHPVNFIAIAFAGYSNSNLSILELNNLKTNHSMINQIGLIYNQKTKILSSLSEYSSFFPLITIILIRKYHGVYKVYTTNQLHIENPFTKVNFIGNHISWDLKNSYSMPLRVKLYLYFSNDTFQLKHVSNCNEMFPCQISSSVREIITCVSKLSCTIKDNVPLKITHLQWQLVIGDEGFEGYTRIIKINSDKKKKNGYNNNGNYDTQKSNGISTKTTVLIVIFLLLLSLIIAGLTTFFVIRKKQTNQIIKKSENDYSLKK